jgi:uncharacterized protein YceK
MDWLTRRRAPRRFIRALAAAALMGVLGGCGTLANTVSKDGGGSGVPTRVAYGGTRTNVAFISGYGDGWGNGILAILDFPISLGLDTAFLPFTAVREIFFPPEPVQARIPTLGLNFGR